MALEPQRILINGVTGGMLPALDRGFCYGDGLFETIRFVGRSAPLWPQHIQRLTESCARLRIPVPDTAALARQADVVRQGLPHSVVRITVSRGISERGYGPPLLPQPTIVIAAFVVPPLDAQTLLHGIALHHCSLRLAVQPRLAGMKHLNRLEQVLARAEWQDPVFGEGLLEDIHGRVISATAANIFAVIDGILCTPALHRCGVAGVARAEIVALHGQVHLMDLALQDLWRAEEVFLSSSVRGIVPVRQLGQHHWLPGAQARALQAHWQTLGFATE